MKTKLLVRESKDAGVSEGSEWAMNSEAEDIKEWLERAVDLFAAKGAVDWNKEALPEGEQEVMAESEKEIGPAFSRAAYMEGWYQGVTHFAIGRCCECFQELDEDDLYCRRCGEATMRMS